MSVIYNGYNRHGYLEGLVGDSISAIPVIKHIALTGPTFMQSINPEVAGLIPKYLGIKPMYLMPNSAADLIYKVSIHELFERYQHTYHPTVGLFHLLGFNTNGEAAIRPEIEFEVRDEHPRYDFVISAISRANGVRMWPLDEWRALIPQLPGTVCMVGLESDGRPFEGIDYYYDHPLADVAAVLSKAGVVITIDNGISRLMHAVGGKHLLLCSNAVQLNWGGYPEAHILYGPPKEFGVQNVLDKVRSIS